MTARTLLRRNPAAGLSPAGDGSGQAGLAGGRQTNSSTLEDSSVHTKEKEGDTMGKTAVLAGQLCLDMTTVFAPIHYEKVSQLFVPGKLITLDNFTMTLGGAVSNTGLCLAKQGTEVRLMGRVGTDGLSDVIRKLIHDHNVDPRYLIVDPTVPTSCTVVMPPRGLDRMFLQFPGTNDTFTMDDLDYDEIARAALFHFGYPGIMKRMYQNDGAELIAMYRKIHDLGVATSLDMVMIDPDSEAARTDWRKCLQNVMPYVDFFVPSIGELAFMIDRKKFDELQERANGRDITECISIGADVRPLADELLSWGARVVMIKCGVMGIYVRTAGREALLSVGGSVRDTILPWADREVFEQSYVPKEVVSGLGAGDCCIAAFLGGILAGCSLEKCLQYAAGTGASNVEAYDSLSGVNTFAEIDARIAAGWKKQGEVRW